MKNLNLPNKLIIFRFLLTIAIIILLLCAPLAPSFMSLVGIEQNILNYIALSLFIIAAITDYYDGKIARSKNQITEFGKLFDPIADKILINSILIIFGAFGKIPIWVVLIFIIRDLLVEGLRMSMTSKKIDISADKWGKYKTIFQFLGLVVLFFVFPTSENALNFNYSSIFNCALIPIYIALFFSIYSGWNYYSKNWYKLISK